MVRIREVAAVLVNSTGIRACGEHQYCYKHIEDIHSTDYGRELKRVFETLNSHLFRFI